MRNRVSWLKITVICMILILSTTGCWNRRELDTLAIVMGIALDKPKDPGKVQLTAQIVKPAELKTTRGGAGTGHAFLNIKNTGETVFGTIRGLSRKFNQRLYFQHNQILIFSQDIAKEGMEKYIDYFLRVHETRLTVYVLVAKDKASEILEVQPQMKRIPAMDITDKIETQAFTSESAQVKLEQFLTRLMSKTTAPIAPLIEVSGEGNEKTALVSGTAVFKKDKLAGQLDASETRGLLWVIGEVKSGIIDVVAPDGDGKVSIEILRASSKITPEIEDGKIHIKVIIKEEGNLGSQSSRENFLLPSAVKALNKKNAAAIQSEVQAALKKARKLKTDIFGFGDLVHQRYSKQWQEYETRWDEVFPNIEVIVSVETELRRMGRITRPAYPEKE